MIPSRIVPCFFITLITYSRCEFYTAIVDLERLLYTEGEIVRTLDQYLAIEERRLEKVRWLQSQFDRLYKQADGNVEAFLSNPVNAYLLVKHLTADWKEAENLIQGVDSKALIENITHYRNDLQFPDEEDLSGAATALMRLQDTYKLDTASLARGQIQGTKPSTELSVSDCYELGRQAFNNGDQYHTLLWMQEALNRVDVTIPLVTKVEIMEYVAYSTFMEGNLHHAVKLTKEILDYAPNHPRAPGNLQLFEKDLLKLESQKRGDDGEEPEEPELNISPQTSQTDVVRATYEKLCRGEETDNAPTRGRFLSALFPKPNRDKDSLKCRYLTNNSPVLLLQPVEEEEMHFSPRIVVYHNVLSDKEISLIKMLAQPHLKRATVQNAVSGDLEPSSYRISKSAWLKDDDHDVIERITRRIEAITGLNMFTSEELQVVNYGIGGHYEPHFDFAQKEEVNAFKSLGTGNRIATWLNYMSNVDAGGATVFPEIGIGVWPEKGSAAFWYNLLKNGECDFRTKHAACPVLAGSKWVSNKWIHENGQEFRRKCSLNPHE